MNSSPIGIFDSGIGGLTVVRAVYERLPHESTVYFGDTARVPYGPKSPDTVRRYSLEILEWLLRQDVKAVVVACNTSTAHALETLQAHSPVPVVGVTMRNKANLPVPITGRRRWPRPHARPLPGTNV